MTAVPKTSPRAPKPCARCIAPAPRSCCATRGTRPAPRRWSPTRRALATTSVGVAQSLGYEDGGHIPAEEAFAALARIVAAVDVPVTADCEAGYGLGPARLRRGPARRRRRRLQPRGHRPRHRRAARPGRERGLPRRGQAGRPCGGRRPRAQRARRRARARRHARGRPRARPRLPRGGRRLRLPDLLPRGGGHRRLRRGRRRHQRRGAPVRARRSRGWASSASRARASAAASSTWR